MSRRLHKSLRDKTVAEKEVIAILEGHPSPFYPINFKDYQDSHKGYHLKSTQYQSYQVLRDLNTTFNAGWMVCPYNCSGYCTVGKVLLKISKKKGGTNRFGRYLSNHQKFLQSDQVRTITLDNKCRQYIIRAAAMVLLLDIPPLSFVEDKKGIAEFARAIFKTGQTIPIGVSVYEHTLLPSHTAVSAAVKTIAHSFIAKTVEKLPIILENFGGAVSIDGFTLKHHGRHYIDFTLHHIEVPKVSNVLSAPNNSIRIRTLLFQQISDVASGVNLHNHLNNERNIQYGVNFDSIQRHCTILTDGAAAMVKMVNISVSSRMPCRDERWMRCLVHILNTSIKYSFKNCKNDPMLCKILEQYKVVKRIVEDSKRSGWNSMLPHRYHLLQDMETRSGTNFLVAERFLKSSSEKGWNIVLSQNRTIAKESFESLEKSFPYIDATVESFTHVYDATVEFEKSDAPTSHRVLPHL